MLKIYMPPLHNYKIEGSAAILHTGIINHPHLELAASEVDCDFIFLDFRHSWECSDKNPTTSPLVKHPHKTIMIDYSDDPNFLLPNVPDDVLLYFKRSMVNSFQQAGKLAGTFFPYNNKKIKPIPISYIIKDQALSWDILPFKKRNIDISVFFNTVDGEKKNVPYRNKVARLIKKELSGKYNVAIGTVGATGQAGRNTIQQKYYDQILDSKIVVTCNPPHWEGDWRLFEALSGSPLVMVDRMITPVKNKFIDGEHLIYYDVDKLSGLIDHIDYYMGHLNEAQSIATNGYNHTRQYHTAEARMQEVLDEISRL